MTQMTVPVPNVEDPVNMIAREAHQDVVEVSRTTAVERRTKFAMRGDDKMTPHEVGRGLLIADGVLVCLKVLLTLLIEISDSHGGLLHLKDRFFAGHSFIQISKIGSEVSRSSARMREMRSSKTSDGLMQRY